MVVYCLLVHRCIDTLPEAIMSPQFLHTKLSFTGVASFCRHYSFYRRRSFSRLCLI